MAQTDYAQFGEFAWMYNADPDVKYYIDLATREQWPPEKLAAFIRQTPWWRLKEDSERAWNKLIAENPQEAADRFDTQLRSIKELAQQLGVPVDHEVARGWADASLRYSWTQQQLLDTLLTTWTYHPDTALKGKSATVVQSLKSLIAEYSVPVSDATLNDWAHQVLQGAVDVESFKGYLAQTAAADNPWMKEALDAGFTVRNIMDPYLQRAAQELGISPAEIDLSDAKWRQLFEITNEKGERVRPDTRSILKIIRQDERFGFDTTDSALNAATDLNNGLLRMFGAVG
jgi:hypothetical protein